MRLLLLLLLAGCPSAPADVPPHGALLLGRLCDDDFDCGLGGSCHRPTFDNLGVCAVRDCFSDDDCDGDDVCAFFDCVGRCGAAGAAGDVCFFSSDVTPACEPMTTTCGAGLRCVVEPRGFSSEGTCARQ